MGIKFFGQYLLGKRVITSEQLLDAIEYQQERNLRFGEYAVLMGLLSKDQVDRLNLEQRRTDERIGELGVRLGMLSQSQLDEILTRQKNDYLFIGEALVERGYLRRFELERQLEAFKEDQATYRPTQVRIPPGFGDEEFIAPLVDLTQKMLLRVAGLTVVLGNPRFGERIDAEPQEFLTNIDFVGDIELGYLLRAPGTVGALIASEIMGEEISEDNIEILEDAFGEFCNMVCGNAAARYAQIGKSLDISPPSRLEGAVQRGEGRWLLIYPLHLVGKSVATALVGLLKKAS